MKRFIFFIPFIFLIISCNNSDYSPKPKAFFRINFPEKTYEIYQSGCPFEFQTPTYSVVKDENKTQHSVCWKNIDFPQFNARLHLSYFDINSSAPFQQLSEDARTFAFKHTSKATAIEQKKISNRDNNIYGIAYHIEGNTASNYQFYISDSTKHYLRGALYFNEKPNLDSIQPVLNFLKEDIEHMINTFRWK